MSRTGQPTRRYLVTGAATGIGRAVAHRLCSDGAKVTGVGLDEDEGLAQQRSARSNGYDFTFCPLDVSHEGQVSDLIAGLGQDLAGVVNCAGIYPPDERLEDMSLERFRQVLEVNLVGTFLICRATLPLLRRSGGGSIVNLSSVHANVGAPGQAAYAASKAAIVAFTRQIAVDYAADRIRANSVLLGSVDTRITRAAIADAGSAAALGLSFDPGALGRVAVPAEAAAVVAFLLSEESSFITASALLADGGLTSRIL
jgi:NAD(P)-dependent dehydrogenase (short-subunit alcohol dehydrogenase family)